MPELCPGALPGKAVVAGKSLMALGKPAWKLSTGVVFFHEDTRAWAILQPGDMRSSRDSVPGKRACTLCSSQLPAASASVCGALASVQAFLGVLGFSGWWAPCDVASRDFSSEWPVPVGPSMILAGVAAFSIKKPPLYHRSPSVSATGMRCRPRHFNSLMSGQRAPWSQTCPKLGCGRNDLGTLALPEVTPCAPSSPSQMPPSLPASLH